MYRGAVTGSIVALVAVGSGATCEICWQYIGSAERKNRNNRRSEPVRDTGIEPVIAQRRPRAEAELAGVLHKTRS